MDLHTWFAFFVASWIIAVSPGSGAVLSMSHGLSYGVRKTSATIMGLQLGLLAILLIAGAGPEQAALKALAARTGKLLEEAAACPVVVLAVIVMALRGLSGLGAAGEAGAVALLGLRLLDQLHDATGYRQLMHI